MTRKRDSKLARKSFWNNNYWLRPPYKPDKIFVHHMVAVKWSSKDCGKYFQRAKVSSNYGIGYAGDISQYVEEQYGAYCQGSKYWNQRGISMELANSKGDPDWPVSANTLNACIELVADIAIRHDFGHILYTGDTKGNLCMHKWVATTGCPGPYMSKQFKHIETEANKIIDGKVRVHERGYWQKGDRGRSVANLKRFLRKQGHYRENKTTLYYGRATFKAVKRFQKKHGLAVDGLWGKECQKVYERLTK